MKPKYKKALIITIIIFTAIIIYNVPSMAKYIVDKTNSYFLKSNKFYFNSNLLKTNTATYNIDSWSGTEPFSISFQLFSKENELLFSEKDIDYIITYNCPTDTICSLNKPSGTLYASDPNHSDEIILTITPTRVFTDDESVQVSINAKSTTPYEVELKANFNYQVSKDGVSFSIDDEASRPYLFLKIVNNTNYCTVISSFLNYNIGDKIDDLTYRRLSLENQEKCISKTINISFNPSNVILDNMSSKLKEGEYTTTTINNISYINSFTYTVAPNSAFQIKFYKKDISQNYNTSALNNNSIIHANVIN